MLKKNLIICNKCVRGNFKAIKHRKEKEEWPDHVQKYDSPGYSYQGCLTCGGFGYLATRSNCPSCGVEFWMRPDPITAYVGKNIRTFKGTYVVYTGHTWVCEKCFKKLEK